MTPELKNFSDKIKGLVNQRLDTFLPKDTEPPSSIHAAMRYSVFSGGKRLRPIFVAASAKSVSGDIDEALTYGAIIEMIHTYTLIHDDLPSLDNDDLRRGRLTLHKAFSESMAILAGDALLTLAARLMLDKSLFKSLDMNRFSYLGTMLFESIGSKGTIGGQVKDLEMEGKAGTLEDLEYIHLNKTAKLIAASLVGGGIIGGLSDKKLEIFSHYGEKIGLAFQIVDDILEVDEGSVSDYKNSRSDVRNGKLTYPSLIGLERSRALTAQLKDEAFEYLSRLDLGSSLLFDISDYIVGRTF